MSHQPVQLPVVVIINTVLWPNVTTCWSFWAKKSLWIHRYDGDDDDVDDGDGDNEAHIIKNEYFAYTLNTLVYTS